MALAEPDDAGAVMLDVETSPTVVHLPARAPEPDVAPILAPKPEPEPEVAEEAS